MECSSAALEGSNLCRKRNVVTESLLRSGTGTPSGL